MTTYRHSAIRLVTIVLVFTCTLVLSAACDHQVAAPPAPQHSLSGPDARSAAADSIARTVALALSDDAIRQQVKQAMHDAPLKEHKLDFRAFINSSHGLALLDGMARLGNTSKSTLMARVAELPALEFYMPVKAHRETWRGDASVIVAAQLTENVAPIGFTVHGERLDLSLDRPPEVPTLVLVPIETDFSRPLDSHMYANINDQEGQAIGTLITCRMPNDCLPTDQLSVEKPDADGGDWPVGVYFDQLKVYDDGEAWPRGEPELEVWLWGTVVGLYTEWSAGGITTISYDPTATQLVPFSCAGEEADGLRNFDFDEEGGAIFDQIVLLADTFRVDEMIGPRIGTNWYHRRLMGVKAPYLIKIDERDDGDACPAPEGTSLESTTFKYSWGKSLSSQVLGWLSGLYDFLSGSGNDHLAQWTVSSISTLESWSTTHYTDSDVEIWMTNRGFDRSDIPEDQDPYYPSYYPTQIYPEPQVSISGPSTTPAAGPYTWIASASDGSGAYYYQWQRRIDGGSWQQVGYNSSALNLTVQPGTYDMDLEVTVVSAGVTKDTVSIPVSAVSVGFNACSLQGSVPGGSGNPTFYYSWDADKPTEFTATVDLWRDLGSGYSNIVTFANGTTDSQGDGDWTDSNVQVPPGSSAYVRYRLRCVVKDPNGTPFATQYSSETILP